MAIREVYHLKSWAEVDNLCRMESIVFIKLWTDRCSPCKQLQAEIEALGEEYDFVLVHAKISYPDFFHLAKRDGKVNVPRLMVYKNKCLQYDHIGSKLIQSRIKEICS